jgi:orotidine-5'-phosphate decarboxylase
MQLQAKDRIIVALDVPSTTEAVALAVALRDHVGMFKIGKELHTGAGSKVVRAIREQGGEVFLDLKFHDIPDTVAGASRQATRLGVQLFNLHIVGGRKMMEQAVAATDDEANALGRIGAQIKRPRILGVTLLTSLEGSDLEELDIGGSIFTQELPSGEVDQYRTNAFVKRMAMIAQKYGLDGVVASPKEISLIRAACGKDFLIVTPGIRPAGTAMNDQKRVGTPGGAIAAGADYLVIGRPIYEHKDPVEAAQRIAEEINAALQQKAKENAR